MDADRLEILNGTSLCDRMFIEMLLANISGSSRTRKPVSKEGLLRMIRENRLSECDAVLTSVREVAEFQLLYNKDTPDQRDFVNAASYCDRSYCLTGLEIPSENVIFVYHSEIPYLCGSGLFNGSSVLYPICGLFGPTGGESAREIRLYYGKGTDR